MHKYPSTKSNSILQYRIVGALVQKCNIFKDLGVMFATKLCFLKSHKRLGFVYSDSSGYRNISTVLAFFDFRRKITK